MNIARQAIVRLIKVYQATLSPWFGSRCRFYPSCSEYAQQCITKRGVIVGGFEALCRLLRCNPLHPGGCDPPA